MSPEELKAYDDARDLPALILISGHAGAGKDTLAKMIKCELSARGQRVLITHFADVLKYICVQYLDWDGNKDEYGRQLLQYVGTGLVREYNEDWFVSFLWDIFFILKGNWDYVIIPDARFPNEIEGFRDDFYVEHIRISRDAESQMTKDAMEHISETALDSYTAPDVYTTTMTNNGSIDELHDVACQWVKDYLARRYTYD